MKPNLHIAPCSHEAAKFAVTRWHYSRSMPGGKRVHFGVWEDGEFVGAIVFSHGANNQIGSPYGLTQQQVCELVRVAMRPHDCFVSQALAIAIRALKKSQPGLRLIVSYADEGQGHHGGIYQATNWIYAGTNEGGEYRRVGGRIVHPRTIRSRGLDATQFQLVTGSRKHRYLYPLDKAMRAQVTPLARPYPKPAPEALSEDAPCHQQGEGGADPTPALHSPEAADA